jgi:hypothetical protein
MRAMTRAGFSSESNEITSTLSPTERERARILAKELSNELEQRKRGISTEILRAALQLIVNDLAKRPGVQGEKQK